MNKILDKGVSKAPDHGMDRDPSMMSDAEILRMFEEQESGEFAINPDIIPDGMVYEWKRQDVYGMGDTSHMAELLRMGWRQVPYERHEGYFAPPGNQGPVTRKGMVLMELPEAQYSLRQRYQTAKARQQVIDKEEQLGHAPPGQGPRDVSPKIAPRVRRGYERVAVE